MTRFFFTLLNTRNWPLGFAAALCIFLNMGFSKDAPHPRPFAGTYATTITILDSTLPHQQTLVYGTGTATHLGRSQYEATTYIDRSTVPTHFEGDAVFTAADGDELHTSYTGTTIPLGGGRVYILRHFDVTQGSTGRFVGASGSFTGISYGLAATTPSGVSSFSSIRFEGSITY